MWRASPAEGDHAKSHGARSGYREVDHTADCAIEVWAVDRGSLFSESANAMYAVAGAQLLSRPRVLDGFHLDAPDLESLLVLFLTELLWRLEQRSLAFIRFKLDFGGSSLAAEMRGGSVARLERPIKAVTFHNLDIHVSDAGLSTQIVFDV